MVWDVYQSKLVKAEEAVKIVKSGDWVDWNSFNGQPIALDKALAARKDELADIKIRGCFSLVPIECIETDPERNHFIYNTWHQSGRERKYHDRGLCSYIPIAFHELDYIYSTLESDVTMMTVCPMDNNGYFNVGPQATYCRSMINKTKKLILEINTKMPVSLGGSNELVHISEVDYIVEGDNPPLVQVSAPAPKETDRAIAVQVVNEIHDGACIQLGIGALPNLIGQMIADAGIRHLGVHTEMLADAYIDMYEAGCIDGTCKAIDPRKMVYGFALGSQRLYDFVNNNPICAVYSGQYTNNPNIASRNKNFIAIYNCIEVDLFGQVASEASEGRHISGTGGQLDLIKAAFMSRGGKGIICLASTFKEKDGSVVSRIRPTLAPGTIATLPRTMTHYVATEWGIVSLKGLSTWERAEKLISIAHPDFRDDLVKEAERLHIWVKTQRIR
ncbi:MAG: acetyl-CoA hydrolase/transferase family protein [Ignavibacteriales bacterium]